ncbi:hypothetical protein ACFLVL_01980 [Chloroflexota bacterium]
MLIPLTTISAPASASSMAMPLPIPRPLPVTIATLPSSENNDEPIFPDLLYLALAALILLAV